MLYKKKPVKTDKIIKDAIALAIEKLTTDVKSSTNAECNIDRAHAIRTLAEAYETISHAKR